MITHYSVYDSSIPMTHQFRFWPDRLYLGNLPINDIIPDEATRGKLENGEYECVVIYDEKSITKIAKMVYQTITRTTQTRVAVLKGTSRSCDFTFVDGTKVECVLLMVVVSILPHAEFWPNHHREDATHFKVLTNQN